MVFQLNVNEYTSAMFQLNVNVTRWFREWYMIFFTYGRDGFNV